VHNLAQILDRLHSGAEASSLETGILEFKQEGDSVKRTLEIVADAVVCLANSEGGQVVLGVADRPGETGSVLGVSSELSVDVVVLGIFERTRDLQSRGILNKLDDKSAGPGVRYGPGPYFPGPRQRKPKRS